MGYLTKIVKKRYGELNEAISTRTSEAV